MYFLMTNDVECHSIPLNRCDSETAKDVYEIGLPRLLDLLSKHDIQSTFYFTGKMAEMVPEAIELVMENGHEIGCHGYDHSPDKALDLLNYEEQVNEIRKAKGVIESIAGRIESFRAPAARINEYTVRALETTDFTSDSSVCSQRFDGTLSFGLKTKVKWLFAPRMPYFLSYESIIREGNSNVLEVPISALLSPFIGTTMRISPMITRTIQKYLFHEAKKTDKPIVFLFHPNECLDVGGGIATTRRSKSTVEYVFGDVIRQQLKLRNLGSIAIQMLDNILTEARREGFEFQPVRKYVKQYSDLLHLRK